MAQNWLSKTLLSLEPEGVAGDGTARDIGIVAGVAVPAGGATTARFQIGATAAFGVYFGSGAPTVVAAKGSLYLRTDGSSTSTRAYIATDSAGTWTAITTAA